jgi:hypothetical protein
MFLFVSCWVWLARLSGLAWGSRSLAGEYPQIFVDVSASSVAIIRNR